jgi:hypothetical protein
MKTKTNVRQVLKIVQFSSENGMFCETLTAC